MIISASRRTDIPAFYTEWFMKRLRAGWCDVANPWNPKQVSRVSLAPDDVDLIVFWSKNPGALLPRLDEIERLGIRYMFLFTLNDYPPALEPRMPPVAERIALFRKLARKLGTEKVVWRYDPIVVSQKLGCGYHRQAFKHIAGEIDGYARRVIVSVVDFYAKTERRLAALEKRTGDRFCRDPFSLPEFGGLIGEMLSVAADNGMEMQSCAEDGRMAALGVKPGKCIDGDLIRRVFGIEVSRRKDTGQRDRCLCVESRDIGAPDTCPHGCEYCYSTSCDEKAVAAMEAHDAESVMLG